VLDYYEHCEQKKFFDQEDKAAQAECESYGRLDSRRPEEVVELVPADVTDREPGEPTVGRHSTEWALA
jgi:hypothetical protein